MANSAAAGMRKHPQKPQMPQQPQKKVRPAPSTRPRPLVAKASPAARPAGDGGRRGPRPLVSAAYQARLQAAQSAAQRAASRSGGTPAAPVAATTSEGRWEGHPLLGTLVRLAAVAIPLAASVGGAVVASRAIDRPSGLMGTIGWWVLITVIATVVLVLVDRVARRLLPLAALLRLSMVFPDQAPSRFSVAVKAGTTRNLKQQMEEAKHRGVADEPSRGAERILTLVGALNAHDRGTRGHSERVRAFNDLIAEEMRLPQADRDRLRWAALLHDIGKLHVSSRILNKPGKPTDDEWEALRSHPAEGARIAAPLAGWLGPWGQAIEEHHERWDGTGYPHRLAGEDISLGARIVAVADVFEVMTAPRPYKRPVSAQAAREELARCAGSHFDPAVVRAFLNVSLGKLRMAMGPISWLAQLPFIGAMPRLEGVALAAGRTAATAAGTATGVSAMAVSGILSSPGHAPADNHAPEQVQVLRDAASASPAMAGRPGVLAPATGHAMAAPSDGATPAPPPAPGQPPAPAPAAPGPTAAPAPAPAARQPAPSPTQAPAPASKTEPAPVPAPKAVPAPLPVPDPSPAPIPTNEGSKANKGKGGKGDKGDKSDKDNRGHGGNKGRGRGK